MGTTRGHQRRLQLSGFPEKTCIITLVARPSLWKKYPGMSLGLATFPEISEQVETSPVQVWGRQISL